MISAKPLPRRGRLAGDGLYAAVLLAVLFYLMMQLGIPRVRTTLDDWRYGRPRTMLLAAAVGHDDDAGRPTQLIAMNLNRQVAIVEIPGGDVAKTRTLTGPYLFGADEDLTPIRIRLEPINGDTLPDLVVSIKAEEIVYINDSGNFRLIMDAERAELEEK